MSAVTRRTLLAGATALAARAPVAALAATETTDSNALAMEAVIGFKQAYVIAYRALLRTPGLDRELRAMLSLYAAHERQHVVAMLAPTEFLGGVPPLPPTPGDVVRTVRALGRARGRRAVLQVAAELEHASLQMLVLAEQQLTDARLIQTVAEVMCCDAQHLAQIRRALGVNPIPTPFEAGKAH